MDISNSIYKNKDLDFTARTLLLCKKSSRGFQFHIFVKQSRDMYKSDVNVKTVVSYITLIALGRDSGAIKS
jgi:hypothetical protein